MNAKHARTSSWMALAALLLGGAPAAQPQLAPAAQASAGPRATRAAAGEVHEPRQPVAILYAGDFALAGQLARACELWWDAGHFALGAVSAPEAAGLEERGAELVALPPLAAGEQLYLLHAHGGASASAPQPGLRSLFTYDGRELVAASEEALCALLESDSGRRAHCGPLRIERSAAQPAPVFRWRGLPGGAGPKALGSADPRIQALVAQVSQANIQATTASLASIPTRRADKPGALTAQNQLVAALQSFGYAPTLQTYNAAHAKNVVAEIPGALTPARIVVAGAHYDSINGSGANANAPGADDNASGTAALLEIARVLKLGGPYENTIRLVFFSGEELGLLGSAYNAQQSKLAGEQLLGMLNMDMVAFRKAGDLVDCDFTINASSSSLTEYCDALCALNVPNWASYWDILDAGSSDHASYTTQGFPAAYFSEDLPDYFTGLHTLNDTVAIACTDFALARLIAQGVLASAAGIAEPVDLAIAHTPLADTQDGIGPYAVNCQVTSLSGQPVNSVELHWSYDGGANWQSAPLAPAGGNTWSGLLPSGGSPKTVRYYLRASEAAGGSEALPLGADLGGEGFAFFVGQRQVLLASGFEAPNDEGFTHQAASGTDDWQRGAPLGKGGDPALAAAGAKVWGTDLGGSGFNGEYASNSYTRLATPLIDASSASNVHLEFRRWLTVDDALFDQAQIFVNGQLAWQNPATPQGHAHLVDTGWRSIDLDISAWAAGVAATSIEFRLKSNGSLHFGGWNLDELRVSEHLPAPPPGPPSFALAPASAAAVGGIEITASGSGLGGAQSLSLGGLPLPFTQGAGELRFTLPLQGQLGNTPVVVNTAAGSGSADLDIVATDPPALLGPASVALGSTLPLALGAAPGGIAWLIAATQPGATDLPGVAQLGLGGGNLLDLHLLLAHGLGPAGTWGPSLPVPGDPQLSGLQLYLQALTLDAGTLSFATSGVHPLAFE